MYQPTVIGTTHQPFGFDQIGALYQTYSVRASAIKVIGIAVTGATGTMWAIAADATTSTTPTFSNTDELMEKFGHSNVRCQGQYDSGSAVLVMKRFQKTKSLMHNYRDSNNEGNINTNPPDKWFWNIGVINDHPSVSTRMTFYIKLTYYVTWTQPQDFPQS